MTQEQFKVLMEYKNLIELETYLQQRDNPLEVGLVAEVKNEMFKRLEFMGIVD